MEPLEVVPGVTGLNITDVPTRRYTRTGHPVGVVQRGDGKPVITGYAAVFYDPNDPGTEYRIYDDIVERIMPGAFDRAIREDDVRGLFNHDDSLILGRVKAGTMRLSVDAKGLKYEIDPPDTQYARDLMESLKRGDVTGSSFMFRPRSTSYRTVEGVYVVQRDAVELFDCGPVSFPAYDATVSQVRSADDANTVRLEVQSWLRHATPIYAVRARAIAVETLLR